MDDWSARSEAQQKRWARERVRRNRIAPYVEEFRREQQQRMHEERQERVRFWANLERRSPLAAERLPAAQRYILRPLQNRDFSALVGGIATRAMQKAMADFRMLGIAEFMDQFGYMDDAALLANIDAHTRSASPRRKQMSERLPRSQRRFIKALTEKDWISLINGRVSPRMADAIFGLGV